MLPLFSSMQHCTRLWPSHPFILHPRFLQFIEIWFKKYGSRNLVREKWLTRKKNWVCRTTFLEQLFYTFLEKCLQNKWSTSFFVIIKYLNCEMKTYNNVVIGIGSSSCHTIGTYSSFSNSSGGLSITESNFIKIMVSNFSNQESLISKANLGQFHLRPFNQHLDFWKSRSWEIKVCFRP